MKVKTLIVAAAALLLCPLPALADGVGSVKELTGTVTVRHMPAGDTAALVVGAPILAQDIVETALQSRAKIVFIDGTEIVLSGHGKLDVEDFSFDAEDKEKNKARFNFTGGAFSYLSGLIAKKENPDVQLKTDYGSIGIRGTRILCALKNGLNWIYVDKGEIEFSNTGGKTQMVAGNGTSVRSATDAPRPPYLWGEDEINWLQRAVDDPAAQDTPAMVARLDEATQQRSRQAAEPMSSPTAGASAGAISNEIGTMDTLSAAPAAAAPAAPAAPAAEAVSPAAETVSPAAEAAAPAMEGAARANMAEEADMAPAKSALARAPAWRDITPAPTAAKADADAKAKTRVSDELRFETDAPATFPLAEIDPALLQPADSVIELGAQLKAEKIKGSAYLELRVHTAGQDGPEIYARSIDDQLTAAGDWRGFTTSFALKDGARPDKITASLVINGTGAVLVKELHLRAAAK